MDIMEFLKHYEKNPCLWDRSSPHYKNKRMREAAERVLMKVMHIEDSKSLKSKIRSIRGTYNNEIRKIKTSIKSETDKVYEPKLLWFSFANSFLYKNVGLEDNIETERGSYSVRWVSHTVFISVRPIETLSRYTFRLYRPRSKLHNQFLSIAGKLCCVFLNSSYLYLALNLKLILIT